MILREEQAKWVRAVLLAMAEHGSCLGVSPTGSGKCLGKGTPVLMYDGSIKPVEEVQMGELLMGPDSKPRRVESLARGSEMLYEVRQSKSNTYIVNESHILSLKIKGRQVSLLIDGIRYKSGQVVNICVRDYLKLGPKAKMYLGGWRAGVNFEQKQDLAIDPYILGVWLGDGTRKTTTITSADREVLDAYKGYAEQIGMGYSEAKYQPNCVRGRIHSFGKPNKFKANLEALGVLDNKHIPEKYKVASKHERLQLLAGIVDTDGCLSSAKTAYEIVFKNRQFADDFVFVARSVGLRATIHGKWARPTKSSEYKIYWRVFVTGNIGIIPVKVERRKIALTSRRSNHMINAIEVVEAGLGDYYGFEISGSDRLFLLGDFTVTHNTVMFNEIIRRCVNKKYRVLVLAHREELLTQAQNKLWKSHKIIGGIIMSGYKGDYSLPVQIASVQTLVNRQMPKNIQVIIIDEAHHTTAQTYRKILENYPDAKILGVTATPVRSSGEGFEDVFKSMVVGPSIKWLEGQGSLVPARQCVCPLSHAELAKIKVTAGDYNEKQLSAFMCSTTSRQIDMWEKYARGMRTIAFAVDLAHMDKLAAEAKRRGYKCAVVSGSTDKEVRKNYFRQIAKGELDILFNVGVATEGTDIPEIQCVFCCRPTKSLSLYMQMVGRGSRPSEGKTSYLLLDCANLVMTHGEPNKDRAWTLKGEGKRRGSQDVVRVFNVTMPDGSSRIMSATSIPTRLENLQLEERENLRAEKIEQCILKAEQSGHKPVSAMYRFFSVVGMPTRAEIKYIATRLNLSESWVTQQAQKQK